MPDKEELTFKETMIKNVMAWTALQPFSNILLLIIAIQISYAGYGLVYFALPKIHETSKQTLINIQENHIKERSEILSNHKEERKELVEFYDKWIRNAHTNNTKPDNKVANGYGCN